MALSFTDDVPCVEKMLYFRTDRNLYNMPDKKYILDTTVAEKKLRRMALEIAERNYETPALLLIGIKENGIVIAKLISRYLQENFKGTITVTGLSMDKKMPSAISLDTPTDFNGQSVILIDDVANSGRTMLYALKPLLEQHPKKIQTLALVERTHKSFPVNVDYVGFSLSTTLDEHIYVEVDGEKVVGAWME